MTTENYRDGYLLVQVRLLNFLRTIEGKVATIAECIEALWPDADREPDNAENQVRYAAWCLSVKNFPVMFMHGRGLRFHPENEPTPLYVSGYNNSPIRTIMPDGRVKIRLGGRYLDAAPETA